MKDRADPDGQRSDIHADANEVRPQLPGMPAPSTYLIGTDGVIRFQYTNPDYTVRLHPDVLLAAARAYQGDADARLQRAYEARNKD
jgi:peroxiredoxin